MPTHINILARLGKHSAKHKAKRVTLIG